MDRYDQHLVDQIRADHRPRKVKIAGRWRRRQICVLCSQPWECAAIVRARDIARGIRDRNGVLK